MCIICSVLKARLLVHCSTDHWFVCCCFAKQISNSTPRFSCTAASPRSVFLQFMLNRVSCCWRLHSIQDLLASIGIKRTLFYRSLTHFLLFCEAGPPRQLLDSPALIILAKVGALQLLKVLQYTWTNEKNLSFNESKDDTISRSSLRKRHWRGVLCRRRSLGLLRFLFLPGPETSRLQCTEGMCFNRFFTLSLA